jgi:tetratricopeptide (TPR) repeat protein
MFRRVIFIGVFLFVFINLAYADLRSAADSIKQEIEKSPDNFKLYFDLGICYTAIDEYDKALEAFNKALELNKDYYLTKYKIAVVYYAMDSLETAKSRFKELRKISKDINAVNEWLRTIYRMCGRIYALQGNIDSAITNYKESMKLYRRAPTLKIELAMVYMKSGDTLEAYKWFDKSLEDYASSERLNWSKSIYLFYLTNFDKAIELNSSILDSNKSGIALYNQGVFRIAAGRQEGFDDIEQACTMDATGFVQSMYNAICALDTGNYYEAEKQLKQEISGLERSGVAKGLLAWTLENSGKEEEAKPLWVKCYCQLPLGTDVDSMRDFISRFIKTIKKNEK